MANKAKTLEEVRDGLYRAFNKAMDGVDNTNYYDTDKLVKTTQLAREMAAAVAALEQDIVTIAILKEAREKGAEIGLDLDKGLVRSITPMGKIKLKPGS
jgi:hypothetical protein